MNRDEKLLAEAYQKILESKPDYLDVDDDGDKDEPMKKALKDKEEVEEAIPAAIAVAGRAVAGHALKNALTGDKEEEVEEASPMPEPNMSNYDSPEMTQKVLDTMENLRTKNPQAFDTLLAQLLKIANHPGDQAQDEYEHKGWPGDGSGEDDFADYNQNEGNDY